MTGSHSVFDSPQKSSVPSLRDPNSQAFLFSQPPPSTSNPAPSPYRAPSFTTPRKPFDVDISSGAENLSSSEQADNEDTPEAAKSTADFINRDAKLGNKRNSLFNFYGRFAPSPGRGDGARPKFSDAIARRVHKKRRRAQNFEKQLALARRPSADSSDEDDSRPTNTNAPPPQQMGRLASLFSFIEQYPNAPALITKYFQTFANAAILTFAFYVIYSVWSTIRADVDRASEDSAAEILAEMATCAKNFVDNRCGGDSRLPALETVCNNWELCMNRDPNAVRRAQVSAHTFAQIINSFVEPISLKTMVGSTFLAFAVSWPGMRVPFHLRYIFPFLRLYFAIDHRTWKTGLPVRSVVLKPCAGGLVVGWVTTSEYPLLIVLHFDVQCNGLFACFDSGFLFATLP